MINILRIIGVILLALGICYIGMLIIGFIVLNGGHLAI